MGRASKPYWKKSHQAFYVTIAGKLHRLGTTKEEADRTFHALSLKQGKEYQALGIPELIDLYLDDAETKLAKITYLNYRMHLQEWAQFSHLIKIENLKPYHVTNYLKTKPRWGHNTRQHAAAIIKLWARWVKNQGYIENNPISDYRNTKAIRRKPPEPGALEKTRAGIISPVFRDYLEIALETGCRPGELMSLDCSRINLDERKAVVVGRKGERTIVLNARACEILDRLVKRWETGPVLRNSRGGQWRWEAVRSQLIRAAARAGGPRIVPNHTRGIYATEAIRNGVDSLMVSKLLGHKDNTIIAKHYANPDEQMLRESAEKATKSSGES